MNDGTKVMLVFIGCVAAFMVFVVVTTMIFHLFSPKCPTCVGRTWPMFGGTRFDYWDCKKCLLRLERRLEDKSVTRWWHPDNE